MAVSVQDCNHLYQNNVEAKKSFSPRDHLPTLEFPGHFELINSDVQRNPVHPGAESRLFLESIVRELLILNFGYIFLMFYSRGVMKYYRKKLKETEELLKDLPV